MSPLHFSIFPLKNDESDQEVMTEENNYIIFRELDIFIYILKVVFVPWLHFFSGIMDV